MFFSRSSRHRIRPSVAREARQIHTNGRALRIMLPGCVNSFLLYFKLSHLMVTVLDVRLSYDVTLREERSPHDIPDLLLSSRQLNICHMNINDRMKESYCEGIVIGVTASTVSITSAGMKLILNCWLVTAKWVILRSGYIMSSHWKMIHIVHILFIINTSGVTQRS